MLRGIDRAAFAVALASRLRSRGVPVGATSVGDFVRALEAAPPDARSRLYWTARITLVRRHSELAVFDAVFAAVFDNATLDLDPHARRSALGSTGSTAPSANDDDSYATMPGMSSGQDEAGSGLPWTTLPPTVGDADDSDSLFAVPERLPSEIAGLADVPFERLSAAEMELLGRWIESALRVWPTRRSRRVGVSADGHRISIRPTIARSRRTGWEPIHLVRVKPVERPRRVVMLCDVSQSMQAQAAAYLHLMRALVLVSDAEVFAFATTSTRLTTVLAHRSAEVAIDQATSKVVDRFGGTRIATNIQALLSSLHGGSMRGAVVIIGSDGWDSDSPAELAAAMARLRRRAYRVIWMNPRASAPDYEPRVATMAAALPYCDAFLPADTFRSLRAVVAEIGRSRDTLRIPRDGAGSTKTH
jgi:uncharacterized protein